jgi:4-amino-4-deoxy-L-arabinose transferase-like glycosyltransferase
MLYTSIIVELLRSQPRLTFWLATLAQAAVWWIVPSLLYSAPPGDLPLVLAIGHEFQLGSYYGPPLAFWVAEAAYTVAGIVGVYFVAQACVVATYYLVFTLGRAIVGIHHAVFAVLLMVGVFTFTAPTANFGPAVLAMPLTAFALLHLWRAIGERQRRSWFLLALALGLLLLTTYAGLALVATIVVFLVATRRGRRALRSADPWLASFLILVVLFPHLIWLDLGGGFARLGLELVPGPVSSTDLVSNLEQLLVIHAGLLTLVVLGSNWHFRSEEKVPVFVRSFTDPLGRRFAYLFALAPALLVTAGGALLGEPQPAMGPQLILSGLAIVVLAGNSIPWHRPHLVAMAWLLLLIAPPLSAATAVLVLPWLGISGVEVARPAVAMGRFFADNFERSAGAPLTIVAGDPGNAALVALGAPTRPSLYLDATPERSPWISVTELRRRGALVVWPSAGPNIQVPEPIRARFPALSARVPHPFERAVNGRLPPLRIGWGVLRPNQVTDDGGPRTQ